MRIIISAFDDGSYKIDHSDIDAHITASMPDYIASGEVDAADWAATIEAQFENDPVGAIEEGVARGFALGLSAPRDELIAEQELRDLRNVVLVAECDVTVKHLRDLFGWQKLGEPNVGGLSHTGVDRG